LIIDVHGHYTTTPAAHKTFREAQLARLADPTRPQAVPPDISDDEIRESIENNQLRLLRERGGDLMIFSPQASSMEHHVADPATARAWARACNDLIHRVVGLFPEHFAGACQLPQTPGGQLDDSIAELRRCVEELGFVGCNLNPDPSGGHWTSKPLTDEYWYPLYEALVELDVPAMIHVSASCNPNFHALGAHYLNADTSAFMQLVEGDLFGEFPTLRFVIPHGGGAVPYHWGRYRGLADRLGRPPLDEHVMQNVFFDTCVYHRPGIDLLLKRDRRRQHPLRLRDARRRSRHRSGDGLLLG
jgi:4-oxalmesaconate hydratase